MKLKRLFAAVALMCFLITGTSWGAVTGSIEGVVTDMDTQEPLIGVNVAVQGTSLGAITDENGKYVILNVPVGTYTVTISAVGYAKLEIANVQVSVDLATFQDHSLSSRATDLNKTIQVRAERPLVMKDKTTTVDVVSREELLAMPTRGFEQVVGIQNSVVRMNSNVDIRQRGGRESLSQGSEINLRGGRPSEVAYYVDGFSQQDPLSGISTANINNNAIKEVSVTSGAFSAEYGHVASGVVNVTTNSGTDAYHGNVELVSDNVAQSLGYDSFDQNWYSADLSGPLPGIEGGYFFFSGERRYLGDRTPSSTTKEVFEEFGLNAGSDNLQRLPANALKGWSYQGKIDYNFTPTFKLQLSGNGSVDRWQEYRHYYNNPAYPSQVLHSPLYEDKNLGINGKITHTMSSETFYDLSVSYFNTQRLRGDGKIFDDYEAYNRGFANPEYDIHNLFREGNDIMLSDIDTTVTPGSEEDVVVGYTPSYWANYVDRRSSYIGVKGNITSQLNANHTTKLGFDFQRHTVRYFENLAATQDTSANLINRYGFNADAEVDDPGGYINSTKHPINLGIYIQDRFDWRGLIVSAGLRFDYFDYKALRLKDVSDPFGVGDDSSIDPNDLEDSEKFTRVSPRLGISFPVSDRTQMHINYGIFYQRPDLRRLYNGYDFLEARIGAGSYYPFASPNLEPETITQYEVGFRHQLGTNTAIGVTAYYKDVQDLTQIFHQAAVPYAYDFYDNTDFGTIKGVDFELEMRRTRNIQLGIKYSLSYATGTGSYANSSYNIAWKNPGGTPKSTNPLDYDQRHSIIGMFDFRLGKGEGPKMGDSYPLENFGLNTIIQFASGTPYTPTLVYDGVSPNASVQQNPINSINSANLPWSYSVDLKMERRFTIGKYQMSPYLLVRNLFDTENVTAVYEGTGKANTSGYLETAEGQVRASDALTGAEFASRYDLGQQNPKNYSNPRMLIFGLRMSF